MEATRTAVIGGSRAAIHARCRLQRHAQSLGQLPESLGRPAKLLVLHSEANQLLLVASQLLF